MKRETKGESEFWYAGIGLALMVLAVTLTLAARCAR